MRINVKSIYHSTRAVIPHFRKQGHGVFVNISSISAPRPRPNLVWYAGSKGAVSAVCGTRLQLQSGDKAVNFLR